MKNTFLLLSVLLPLAAPGQAHHATGSMPVITTSGSFFALSVADLDASTRWYTEKLGLKVIRQMPHTDATRSSMALLQGGGLTVELVRQDDAQPLGKLLPAGRGTLYVYGIFKVGVVVNDFDRTLAALRARGVEVAIGPFPKRPGQPANVILRDNAGNLLQVFGK